MQSLDTKSSRSKSFETETRPSRPRLQKRVSRPRPSLETPSLQYEQLVVTLQYEQGSSCNILTKCNFCSFTLWMYPALNARAVAPFSFSQHATATAYGKRITRKLDVDVSCGRVGLVMMMVFPLARNLHWPSVVCVYFSDRWTLENQSVVPILEFAPRWGFKWLCVFFWKHGCF